MDSIYQLKITLRGIHPPIWRRVRVRGGITLGFLHDVIQIAMGWTDSHLHCFQIGGATFSTPYPDSDFEDSGDRSDLDVLLREVCPRARKKFTYEYDFGDGWRHEILLEKVIEPSPDARYPLCLAGERACPPEDCGGVWGYANFLEAVADPAHEMHREMLDWVGEEWNAEAFVLEEVNARLLKLAPG